MLSCTFNFLCSNLQTIDDSMLISSNKESVKFSLHGGIGSGHIIYKDNTNMNGDDKFTNKTNTVLINCNKSISQSFAIKYLSLFSKASLLSKFVTIRMKIDSPLVVEYKIADFGYLKYFLAPKIIDD